MISVQTLSQQYWIRKSSPVTVSLTKCSFPDSLNGWAAGDSGIIIHTSNGGNNWNIQNSKFRYNIHEIFFFNKRYGWALGWLNNVDSGFYGTMFLKTTDGGLNWDTSRYSVPSIYFKGIYFLDSLNGFTGGNAGAIYTTSNGGNKWNACRMDSSLVYGFPVWNFNFLNRRIGFAGGGATDITGVVWKTTNYGVNWSSASVSPEPLARIVAFDSLNAIGIGGDNEYGTSTIRTTNGGNNWIYDTTGAMGVPGTIYFRTRAEAWVPLTSYDPRFIVSRDSGRTWTQIPTPIRINHLVFTDQRNGFAVGDSGVILKFNYAVVAIRNENTNSVPGKYILYQNYPNPFNPVTKIKFDIPDLSSSNTVSIKVYNILGKEIITLINENLPYGKYEVTFDGSLFSSGIYFCKLQAGNFSQTRKMILLK